jgi:hypothetical protein
VAASPEVSAHPEERDEVRHDSGDIEGANGNVHELYSVVPLETWLAGLPHALSRHLRAGCSEKFSDNPIH